MRCSAFNKMHARFAQAEGAINRESHVGGIFILLPVVFPPANRAQLHHRRRGQRPISATWTAILNPHTSNPH